MGRGLSNRSESPARHHRSPRRRSPSGREKSPAHRRRSPAEQVKFPSSLSRSPSPRSKRLRRAQAEGESQRVSEKDDKKNQRMRSDRDIHKEKNFVKESDDRKERGSRKDSVGNGSKTRNGRSKSPQRHHRPKNESQSPQRHHRPKKESQSPQPQRHHRSKNESQSPSKREGIPDVRKKKESQSPQRHHRSKNESQSPSKREGIPDGRKKERSVRDASGTGSYRSTKKRSTSPSAHHNRTRHESRSPPSAADNREVRSSRGSEHRNEEDDALEKMNATQEALETKEKQKPSFELSGKLADETNRVKGVTLLFNEPPDARKPDIRWRLYVFKAGEALNEPLYVHRQTCYLFGRERRVADIPTDHPSCSKQHAVLQYRQVEKEQPDGMLKKQVTPYIMDLGSTNGTFINETRVEAQRYYELHEQDTLKFGNSSREYVLLHENSSN